MGWLEYQSKYYDPRTNEPYLLPEALKKAYKDVEKLIRKHLIKRYADSEVITEGEIKSTIKTLWIGKEAIKLIEAGEADILAGNEWMWKRGSDLRKNKTI